MDLAARVGRAIWRGFVFRENGFGYAKGDPFFRRILVMPTIGFNLPRKLGNQCPANISHIGGFYEGLGF